MLLPGKVTFASELLRGLGGNAKIHPFVWSSSIRGKRRLKAARLLADEIDRLSTGCDRVILIGHSHGGNIALHAASLCRTKIDSIVCLATPHVYLRVVDEEHASLNLPVYCSPQTLRNTSQILCFQAEGDKVCETWSNALLTGASEMEAIELTHEWRTQTGSPRLADDGLILRLLESDNLFAANRLTLASHSQFIKCAIADFLGVRQHHAIHSCEIGFAIGRVLSQQDGTQLPISRIAENTDFGVR